jgi:Alcohol dehydrogenase GroES-like domain
LKQVFIKNGAAVVEDVPAPAAAPGEVLVRVANSCISVGTEMSGLQATSEPIWKRAARRPDKVLNAIKMLLTRSVDETVNIVRGQISAGSILGYSAAGTVVGLGAGVEDIEIGDRVACAGAQSALRCYRPAGRPARRADLGRDIRCGRARSYWSADSANAQSQWLSRDQHRSRSAPRGACEIQATEIAFAVEQAVSAAANPKLGRGSSVKHQTLTKTTESARCAASSER